MMHLGSGKIHMKNYLSDNVINQGLCVGCGACTVLDSTMESVMQDTPSGPIPEFGDNAQIPEYVKEVCPGLGVNYPKLYTQHYGHHPENWLAGHVEKVRTGFSGDPSGRSSGLRIPQTLIYLLKTGNPSLVTTCNLKG